ncbi:unnamed protein product, partial [Rotaria sp. Silwood2]
RIAHKITSDVTHVICAKPNVDDTKLNERINVFKKINRVRSTKFHLVSYEWIENCIQNQRLLKELL